MKRLLLIIIFTLSFQHIANADDINDFQIEGMSIGDSLLNFFKKEDIETEKYDEHSLMYKNNKYVQIGASYKKSYRLNIKSKTYDDLSIVLKTIDDTSSDIINTSDKSVYEHKMDYIEACKENMEILLLSFKNIDMYCYKYAFKEDSI